MQIRSIHFFNIRHGVWVCVPVFFLSWINYIRAVCWTYLLHYKRTLTIASILGIIVKKLHCTQHGGGSTVYYNAPSVNESSIQMCLMRKSVTGGLLSFVFERFSDVLVMCFFFCSFQFAFFCLFGRVSEMGACFFVVVVSIIGWLSKRNVNEKNTQRQTRGPSAKVMLAFSTRARFHSREKTASH